jgi:cyclopropane fatty-acyl-phospholipid synthase-like methyltransferase
MTGTATTAATAAAAAAALTMPMPNSSPSHDYAYLGGELDLFEKATRWKSYFASHFRPYLGRRVLEVGAGTGGTTAIMCDGSQDTWMCLEPDARLAARLSPAIASRRLPGCCVVRVGTTADMTGEPPFDSVTYIDVLEHIEDDAGELRRAASVLKPGGHVLALSPAHPVLYSRFDAHVGHHRRYTRQTFAGIAPPELELVKLIYLDAVGMLASVANRGLLRQELPTAWQISAWDKLMVPVSRVIDPLLLHRAGKSLVAVWRKRG